MAKQLHEIDKKFLYNRSVNKKIFVAIVDFTRQPAIALTPPTGQRDLTRSFAYFRKIEGNGRRVVQVAPICQGCSLPPPFTTNRGNSCEVAGVL